MKRRSLFIRIMKAPLPRSLFGRSLMILLVPTILVQAITAYVFFERHWENVVRHMSDSLAGEITFLVHELRGADEKRRNELSSLAEGLMGITVTFDEEADRLPEARGEEFPEFSRQLKARLTMPFTVQLTPDDEGILVHVLLPRGVAQMQVTKKRLASATTYIFIMWMTGSALIFLLIAILFLRNQIRPIARLALAAERFGKGLDLPDFRPSGASEVRRASHAFLIMRERLRRQITTRTDMLSSISHDLRTPLTRMKLQLAMLGASEEIAALQSDVMEMERMIQEYLDFARGVGREESVLLSLQALLLEVVRNYERQGQVVTLSMEDDRQMQLRPSAFRRCLANLIDNAIRYGKRCHLIVEFEPEELRLHVDDEGKGIREEDREAVFRAFTRLDPSRNSETGGVGLGLTIARDIVLGHGGEISLDTVPEGLPYPAGGLRVTVRLPL